MSDYFEMTSDQQDALLVRFYDEIAELEDVAKQRRGDNRTPTSEEYYNEVSTTLDGWLETFGLDSDKLTDVTLANLELGEFEVDILLGLSRLFNLKADIIIFELEPGFNTMAEGKRVLSSSLSILRKALAITQLDNLHLINLNLAYTYKRFSTLYARHRQAHKENKLLFFLDEGFKRSIDYNIECVKCFLLCAKNENPLDPNTVDNLVQAYNSCIQSYRIGTTVDAYIKKYESKVTGLYTSLSEFYNGFTGLGIDVPNPAGNATFTVEPEEG